MDREATDIWLERGILALVLGVLVYSPLAFGADLPAQYTVSMVLVALAAALWGARLWVKPQVHVMWPPVCWAVAGFVIYAFARLPFADVPLVAREETMLILTYATLFFVIINNVYRQEHIRIFVLVMVGLAMLISFYAIYQYFSGSNKIWDFVKHDSYAKQATGTFYRPTTLAAFLAMLLPLGLVFAFSSKFNHAIRIVLGYASVVIIVGLATTFGRGGWFAAAAGVTFLCVVLAKNRLFRLIILSSALMLMIATYLFINSADRKLQQRLADSAELGVNRDVRYGLWPVAVKMWLADPWLGVGAAHFDYRYPAYREPVISMQNRPVHVHNDILNTLVDYGLVGTLLITSAFGLLFWWSHKTWRILARSRTDPTVLKSHKLAFVLGATCSLVAILVHSTTDFNLHIPAIALLTTALLALLTSHVRFATEGFWQTLGTAGKTLVTITLLGVILAIVQYAVQRRIETYWLRQADTARTFEARIACYQKAHATNPENDWTLYSIGELYRLRSWEGYEGHEELANTAMEWIRKAMDINSLQMLYPLRYGMCLDWLKKHEAAEVYFQKALKMDPNSYYTTSFMGWHYFQVGRYKEALQLFEKSHTIKQFNNSMVQTYRNLTQRKLDEAQGGAAAQEKDKK
jgi:O-antigen ligase